jgi:hypothetical protein
MLQKVAFAFVLIAVVSAARLGTQFVLAAHSQEVASAYSAKSDRLVPKECAAATWPDIPLRCLQRIEPRQSLRTIAVSAAG